MSDKRPVQRPRLIRWDEPSTPYEGPPLVLKAPLRGTKRIKLPPAEPQQQPSGGARVGEKGE